MSIPTVPNNLRRVKVIRPPAGDVNIILIIVIFRIVARRVERVAEIILAARHIVSFFGRALRFDLLPRLPWPLLEDITPLFQQRRALFDLVVGALASLGDD
jgi:hypothetical protein